MVVKAAKFIYQFIAQNLGVRLIKFHNTAG